MMALSAHYSKLNYTAMKHFNLLKSLLLLCALIVGSLSGWAADYSYTFSSKQFSSNASVELGSVSWTLGGDGGYWGYDGTKGQQFGSGGSPYKSLTLSTSGISGTITNIVVNASGASSVSAKISCSVGGSSFGTQNQSISSTAKNYTFSGSASGAIEISISQTSSKALYIKSITVTYVSSGGNVNIVDAPAFSPAAGAITAGTTVTLTQATADEIRYTLDGTDPTKTTGTVYSGPIVITTATTIKAIAVEDDDVSSVATAAYSINVATPTFNLESGNDKYYLEGSTFTMSASSNTIYYNLTTDGSTPADPTLSSTEYSGPISITGTTKIKAISVDSYGNASNVVTRTYTGVTPTTLPFSWTGSSSEGKDELRKLTGVALSLASDYAASNAPYRLKFDGEGKFVTIFTDVKPYFVSFSAKLFNATTTGSKLTVQESVDGKEFSDVEEFTINGSANSTFSFTTTNSFNANTRVVRLVLAEKDQNVGVGNIVVTRAESIAISAAGWATYCSSVALDFTGVTALTAYTASKEGSVVKFNKVTGKVPANEGLLVRGESASVPVCASADPVDNLLVGVTAEKVKTAGTVFVLMKGSKGIGFYKNTNDFTLRANSAYLPAEDVEGSTARAFIALDDETTGIADVKAVKEDAEGMFDLQGRKIAKPTKGLYIVNGKKIVVK